MSDGNSRSRDRFKYIGGEFDFNIGLERFDARWTDPVDGRWISQDPLGLGPDSNPYRYVGNAPIDSTDSSGLSTSIGLNPHGGTTYVLWRTQHGCYVRTRILGRDGTV